MHHSTFIEGLAQIYRPKIYLELGVLNGETFEKVLPFCQRAIGVDAINRKINLEENWRIEYHVMTTTEFFKNFKDNVDMVFIDADHSYESVKQDFLNCVKILNKGGLVILHDTDPEHDGLFDKGYCGTSYKFARELEDSKDYNIITMPATEAGLSLVMRKKETRTDLRK